MSNNKGDATRHDGTNPAYDGILYDHERDPGAFTKPKRRIFMWTFIAVQMAFLFWLIVGTASNAQQATNLTGTEADAYAVGTGIGVVLILLVWFVVDVLLFIGWSIVRLSSRRR